MKISSNVSLKNLIGLEELSYIGGDLIIGNWVNEGDDVLNSLTGLEGLSIIGGDLSIQVSDSLTSLTGLEGLNSIGGEVEIRLNDGLINLDGLNNLTSIDNSFQIFHNKSLRNLIGLESLAYVGGELEFRLNDSLNSFDGLKGLTVIGGQLNIRDNDQLPNLAGLNGIDTMGGFFVRNNNALISLEGIKESVVISGNLSVYENPVLNDCEAAFICSYLSNPNGIITIYDNATGCNKPSEIADSCGFNMSCLPYGDYYFTLQENLNSFQSDYPDCTELNGNVIIKGADITDISELIGVTSIGGNLQVYENNLLTNSIGLEHLTNIGGDLLIHENNSLISLEGFENLSSIGGNFSIGSDSLIDMGGLESLTSIGGNLTIENNDCLTGLMGLNGLTSVGGNMHIGNNISLINLNGLEGLTSAGGELWIYYNNSLTSTYGLEGLTSINGSLYVSQNSSLSTIAGLENIDAQSIEYFSIFYNPYLTECAIQSVCDYMSYSDLIISITGNADGCKSPEEVEEACIEVYIEESNLISREFVFYPNPVSSSGKLKGKFEQGTNISIRIYNTFGSCVKNWQFMSHSGISEEFNINLDKLPPGMYFLRMQIGNDVVIKKVLKL